MIKFGITQIGKGTINDILAKAISVSSTVASFMRFLNVAFWVIWTVAIITAYSVLDILQQQFDRLVKNNSWLTNSSNWKEQIDICAKACCDETKNKLLKSECCNISKRKKTYY